MIKKIEKHHFDELEIGAIFIIPVWDSEEGIYWHFTYCKSMDRYIYLGGGIDSGNAIGNEENINDLIDHIGDNGNTEWINVIKESIYK